MKSTDLQMPKVKENKFHKSYMMISDLRYDRKLEYIQT